MSFKEDVASTAGIETAWKAGLHALQKPDSKHVSVKSTRNLRGSVDIDSSLRNRYPNNARWDYVVAQTQGREEFLHWIEIHPAAAGSTVGEILTKFEWLREWLRQEGNLLEAYKREFLWVASGKSSYTRNSPQLKSLAAKGIRFCGQRVSI